MRWAPLARPVARRWPAGGPPVARVRYRGRRPGGCATLNPCNCAAGPSMAFRPGLPGGWP